jgi:hypothetical protein
MAQQLVGAEENGQELRAFVGANPCPTMQWSGLGKSWRFFPAAHRWRSALSWQIEGEVMSYGLPHLTVVLHRFFYAGDGLRILVALSIAQPRDAGCMALQHFLQERSTIMEDIPQWWMKGDWFDV